MSEQKVVLFEAKTHPKLTKCIEEQLIDVRYGLPFYGQFNLNLNFYKKDTIDTCGVNASFRGFNFFYNEKFLNDLSQKEVNFVDIHELFHLLFNHPQRTVQGGYDPYLANVVQDMIINYIIWTDIDHNHVEIPKYKEVYDKDGKVINADSVGKNMALFVPKEYDGPLIFEALYNWINQKRQEKKNQQNSKGKGDQPSQEGDGSSNESNGKGEKNQKKDGGGSGKKNYGPFGKDNIDTYSLDDILDNLEKKKGCWLDSHIDDDIPQDLRDAMVKDIAERIKSRGCNSANLEKTLEKLQKKRKDYLSEIKRSIANDIIGRNKKETITRPSRRGISGVKGNKKVQSIINCIWDTSGSMNGMHEKVLSYIYRNDISINLIQCDAGVQRVDTVKSLRDFNEIRLKGMGGTMLQPAIDLVSEKYDKYNTVILSDGLTDTLNFENIRGKVLIISCEKKCPISKDNGKVKQILVEKNQ